MKLDVAFTPAEVDGVSLAGRTVVVIDVLRATSTIVEALHNGARAVIPVDTVERAIETAAGLGDEGLLCGERGGLPIEGFDLGNSPREFGRERVEGRTLVMSTTNGTRALVRAAAADHCLVGSLLNAKAVAGRLEGREDVLLLCSGRQGRVALEDSLCAGLIGSRLAATTAVEPTDGARAAMTLARECAGAPNGLLRDTAAARRLDGIGLMADIEFCGMLDRHGGVPELRDLRITL